MRIHSRREAVQLGGREGRRERRRGLAACGPWRRSAPEVARPVHDLVPCAEDAFDTLRTLCPDARLLPPLALLGGVEEDGVLYPLEDEQLAEAERQLQAWADTVTASAGTPG